MMSRLSFSRNGRENRSGFSIKGLHVSGGRRDRTAHGWCWEKQSIWAGRGIERNNVGEFVQGTAPLSMMMNPAGQWRKANVAGRNRQGRRDRILASPANEVVSAAAGRVVPLSAGLRWTGRSSREACDGRKT